MWLGDQAFCEIQVLGDPDPSLITQQTSSEKARELICLCFYSNSQHMATFPPENPCLLLIGKKSLEQEIHHSWMISVASESE